MEFVRKLFTKKELEVKIQHFFNIAINLLRLTGFEFENSFNKNSNKKIIVKIIFYWFVVINLILAITSSGASMLTLPIDLDRVTLGLPVVASSLMIVLKAIVIFYSRLDVLDLLTVARSFEAVPKEKYIENSKMFRKFFYVYSLSLLSPLTVNIISPIVKYFTTGEKTFPLDMKFPFEATNKFVYPFILLWTSWNLINGFIIFISTDILVFGIIRIISTEFEALKDKFEESNAGDFKQLVENHNVLFDVAKRLNKIFSVSFFYKFIISSFVICFTAFQSSTSSDLSKIIVNMTICIANFNQIGLQCFYGQMLKNSSENVANSIYACHWKSKANVDEKKALIICIARSQRHVALTALKFGEISFVQFTNILTSTYSYFTLLRQVYFKSKGAF